MAMEVVKVIEEAHESEITSITYNRTRREIFSAADGDKVIRVSVPSTKQAGLPWLGPVLGKLGALCPPGWAQY